MDNTNTQKVIDIKPLSKWKRILLFLGDFFITAIIGFLLYNVAAFPIGQQIIDYKSKQNESTELLTKANNLLVEAGYLFYPPAENNEVKDIVNSVNYTFNVYISYYLFDVENPIKNNPQFGHKIENEVFYKYFITDKDKPNLYFDIFNDINKQFNYFDVDLENHKIALKQGLKERLAFEFSEKKETEGYSEDIKKIKEKYYDFVFYNVLYEDILENDLVLHGISFKNYISRIESISSTIDWTVVISSLISGLVSSLIVYLLIPLIQKEGKTPTMMIMKVDKLLYFNLNYINKKHVLLQYIFHLILALGSCIFYPVTTVGIAYCFNLPLLFIISMITTLITLASLITIFINQHGRTGSDILSFIVVVPTSELDKLYTIDKEENASE